MNLWQALTLFFAGLSAGLFLGAKYVTQPANEYSFGKVKAKGQGNEITAVIKPSATTESGKKRLQIFKRKNRQNEAQ